MNTPYWFSNLSYWSAQVALLVLAAGFLPHIFKIRQPRVLLIYWRALIAVSILLPFAQPWHRPETIATINFDPQIAELTPVVIATSAPPVTHWYLPSPQIIAEIIGLIILAGIAARFTILALGLMKLRQFRRASSPISNHAESSALLNEMRVRVNTGGEFRLSCNVASPVTFGLTAPVILLPERFPTLDAQYQSAIACHELLHVRRRDWAHHLSEEVLRAALWFHPAIAWLIARIRLSREQVVDLEVVKLTDARKPYLEALLEFTNGRALATAIPAPPFLVERQLAERVALMLKEVRMSRTRLIASLTAIAACLALVATLAVWTFPLKAAPRPQQNPPANGIAQGINGGVIGGVTDGAIIGVPGGVIGGVTNGVRGGVTGNGPAQGVKDGVSGGVKTTGPVTLTDSYVGPTNGALLGPSLFRKLPLASAPASQPQSAPKIVVTDIKFEGEVHDADAVRARILKGIAGRVWDGSNNEWLDVIAEVGVRGDFQNHGYFEANVDGVKSQVLDSTGGQQRVIATFNVREGDQFRAGEFTFVGFDPARGSVIPVQQLREQFHLQTGDILNVDELRRGIERITQLYGSHGYLDFTAVPNFPIDRRNRTVAMTIKLVEGDQYHVTSFTVHGLDSATTANLESKIRPGSIYNNSLVHELFDLGNAASGANVRWVDVIHVKRNVEALTVDISLDFPSKTPPSPAASNPNDSRIIGKFQLLPPAGPSSGKFQPIPPATQPLPGVFIGQPQSTTNQGVFLNVAPSEPANSRNPNSQNSSSPVYTAGQNGVSMPKCVYCPAPKYSDEAVAAKLIGTVRLQVTVLANGHPGEVKLLTGIGSGLDEKAVETVRDQWTFTPGKSSDGTAVDVTVPIEVIFQIAPDKNASNVNGVSAPVCEYCPRPEYTSEAKRARFSGTVTLQVTVLANGRAGEIKLTKGVGLGLDEKAIEIVKKKWKFKPATDPNGQPVISVTPIEINFQLY
jgi:TonB family protein